MTNRALRFGVEAALIVAVAVGAGLAHLDQPWITVAVGAAWAAVGVFEYRLSKRPSETLEPGSQTEPGSRRRYRER
jgi:hypothetical protein